MAPNAGAKRHAHYPSFPFHAIRFFQFTSALAVVVLTYYLNIHPAPDDPHMPKVFPLIFIHHGPNKTHEPWFWVMVHTVSHVTVLWIIASSVLQCFHKLRPLYNLIANCIQIPFWGTGFGGLIHYTLQKNILRDCDNGITCRIFEVVIACSVVTLAFTIGAAILDLIVYRRHRRNIYRNLNTPTVKVYSEDDQPIHQVSREEDPNAPYADGGQPGHRSFELGRYDQGRGA